MALQKRTYISGETVITAENLNAIQDEIIRLSGGGGSGSDISQEETVNLDIVYDDQYAEKYVSKNKVWADSTIFGSSNPIKTENLLSITVKISTANPYISQVTFTKEADTTNSNIVSINILAVGEHILEIPDGAKYVFFHTGVNESGTRKTDPTATAIKVSKIEESTQGTILSRLNIGSKLYAIVGDTLQIFKKSIIDNYSESCILKFDCPKGRLYPRYWEYTPTNADIGTSTLTISLYSLNGDLIDSKNVSLITASPTNQSLKILNIGDSTMAKGQIPIEVSRRLKGTTGVATSPPALALSNISLVGRLKNNDGSVGWEGTGGWTYSSYCQKGERAVRFTVSGAQSITVGQLIRVPATNSLGYYQLSIAEVNVTSGAGNIRCTFSTAYNSSFSSQISPSGTLKNTSDATICNYSNFTEEYFQPFWDSNSNSFDIITYINNYSSGTCNYIFILLGINSIFSKSAFASMDNILEDCKILLRNIHSQLPNTKILLSTNYLTSQNGGLGANYNCQTTFGQYETKLINHQIFSMNELYYTLEKDSEFSSYVTVVNTHAQFDSDYSFPQSEKTVNIRSSNTEDIGTNGVHPSDNGYWQIADAEFRAVLAM